jgi:hypothetical protein
VIRASCLSVAHPSLVLVLSCKIKTGPASSLFSVLANASKSLESDKIVINARTLRVMHKGHPIFHPKRFFFFHDQICPTGVPQTTHPFLQSHSYTIAPFSILKSWGARQVSKCQSTLQSRARSLNFWLLAFLALRDLCVTIELSCVYGVPDLVPLILVTRTSKDYFRSTS